MMDVMDALDSNPALDFGLEALACSPNRSQTHSDSHSGAAVRPDDDSLQFHSAPLSNAAAHLKRQQEAVCLGSLAQQRPYPSYGHSEESNASCSNAEETLSLVSLYPERYSAAAQYGRPAHHHSMQPGIVASSPRQQHRSTDSTHLPSLPAPLRYQPGILPRGLPPSYGHGLGRAPASYPVAGTSGYQHTPHQLSQDMYSVDNLHGNLLASDDGDMMVEDHCYDDDLDAMLYQAVHPEATNQAMVSHHRHQQQQYQMREMLPPNAHASKLGNHFAPAPTYSPNNMRQVRSADFVHSAPLPLPVSPFGSGPFGQQAMAGLPQITPMAGLSHIAPYPGPAGDRNHSAPVLPTSSSVGAPGSSGAASAAQRKVEPVTPHARPGPATAKSFTKQHSAPQVSTGSEAITDTSHQNLSQDMSTHEMFSDMDPELVPLLLQKAKRKGKGGRSPALDPRLDPGVDPKKAKRILANRQSAARSKLKQKLVMEGLRTKHELLKTHRDNNVAELDQLKQMCRDLEAKNAELQAKVETLELGGYAPKGYAPSSGNSAAGMVHLTAPTIMTGGTGVPHTLQRKAMTASPSPRLDMVPVVTAGFIRTSGGGASEQPACSARMSEGGAHQQQWFAEPQPSQ